MGLAASVGKDNDELVDNLIDHESFKTEQVEKAMRLVSRGRFMPTEEAADNAYKDSAWKSDIGEPGFLHLSAPCIYASVLENLDLKEGMTFLNVGSGTGYFSSMVGFILGESGISHGVELYENVVNFANERVIDFLNSKETSVFEWCVPQYFIGNAFQIEAQIRYDRIYCGALIPESHRAYFCSFLKIDGVMIMPYGHSLQRITRQSEIMFNTCDISAVTFSHLIPVNLENSLTNCPVKLPMLQPISLQQSCRKIIRKLIRQQILTFQKVEMRSHVKTRSNNNKNGNTGENTTNKQNEGETTTTGAASRNRRPQMTLIPRRLMDHPVVLFQERERGGEETNEPEEGGNRERRVMPVRQLFAMFARERLRRHHAARAAQQAAGQQQQQTPPQQVDSDSNNSSEAEEEVDEFHLIGHRRRRQQQPPQFYNGPHDNSFGFQFVTEEDNDIDDGINLNDLFEHHEDHHDDENDRNANITVDENIVEVHENTNDESISENIGNSLQDLFEHLEERQNDENDQSKNPNENKGNEDEESSRNVTKSGINKRQRQRTDTTSTSSFENAPKASKIQRQKSTSYEESTSQVKFIDEQVAEEISSSKNNTKPTPLQLEEAKKNIDRTLNNSTKTVPKRSDSADISTSAPSSSHSNSSFSGGNDVSTSTSDLSAAEHKFKDSNVIEISAEQQNTQMKVFHAKFYECIDQLPLTVQMRNYLKFGL